MVLISEADLSKEDDVIIGDDQFGLNSDMECNVNINNILVHMQGLDKDGDAEMHSKRIIGSQ